MTLPFLPYIVIIGKGLEGYYYSFVLNILEVS